ncbi:MAG: carboxypeptidase-like regulatory domain-containing protein [Chitinophagaceae bacterium]|nr:carboxypeptidase-like regulatory domain-containing protein [Chitinophagaceae bacterium]
MNKTKIASFLVLLCLLGTTCVEAQVLKGKVVDDTQSPPADVYLLNARNGHHAHTDASGSFVLEGAEKGDTILLSLVSYEAKKYVVTEDHSDVKIILHKVHFHLSEVVVRSNVSHLNVISAIDLSVKPCNIIAGIAAPRAWVDYWPTRWWRKSGTDLPARF